jgi:hypothetical protein
LEEVDGVGIYCCAFKSYELFAMHQTAFCHLWIIKTCVQPVLIAGGVLLKSCEENCVCVCVLMHFLGHNLRRNWLDVGQEG